MGVESPKSRVEGPSPLDSRLATLDLEDEQAPYALLLASENFRLLLKPSLPGRFLVQELVVVVRLSARDLPGSGDLEPLGRCFARLDLWHSAFYFLCSASAPAP